MTDAAGPDGGIAGRLVRARLNAGARRGKAMTQTELARLVGVASPTVSQWESGTAQPALGTIAKIAEVLGVSPGWIAFGEKTTPASQETGAYSPEKWTDVTAEANAALAAEEAAQAAKSARRKNGGRTR